MENAQVRIKRLAVMGLVAITIAAATLSPTSAAPAQAGLFDDRAGTTSSTAKSKKKNNPLSEICDQLDDAASQITDLLDAVGGGGGGFDIGDLLDSGKILKGLK